MIDETIGQYKVTKHLGSGGMGDVYLALDSKLEREVALKFLPKKFASDPDARQRFQREAKALATLNHPNIVTVHDVGEHDGVPFIAMEYLQGQSLKESIAAGDVSIDDILSIASQIAEGLTAAHKSDVVHRDIKSENIIISAEGRVTIMDFGLATWRGVTQVTQEGSTVGTMAYMSPEQAEGKAVDQRSDLWSLGVVLYEMITGRLPFEGEHQAAVVYSIVQDAPQPVLRYRSDCPAGLQEVVGKALEKDPEMRFQTASGFLSDLNRLRRVSGSSSVITALAEPASKPASKRGMIIGVGVGIAAIIALLFVLKPWQSAPPEIASVTPGRTMLAVLPFKNLGAPGDEYFADGVTEEILTNLSRIKGLGVISRTSTLQYRDSDKSLKEIGNELGVEYVLEASIQWNKTESESRIRLHPQLIRVTDDVHVWADRFDAVLDDLFKVQSDIATQVADALSLALLKTTPNSQPQRPTEDSEAYELYLTAKGYQDDFGSESQAKALELFSEAIARDSGFALAWVGMSKSLLASAFDKDDPDMTASVDAKAAIEMALRLEPDLPEAHVAMGSYHHVIHRDYESALREFQLAKELGSQSAEVFTETGFVLMRMGQFVEAVTQLEDAVRLAPTSEEIVSTLGFSQSLLRRFEQADKYSAREISFDPSDASAYRSRVLNTLRWKGRDSAKAILREASRFVNSVEVIGGSKNYPQHFFYQFDLLDLDPESLITEFETFYSASAGPSYYLSLQSLHTRAGNTGLAQAYHDTTKAKIDTLLRKLEDRDTDTPRELIADLHGSLASSYSDIGNHELALQEARTSMEMLSVSTCHL